MSQALLPLFLALCALASAVLVKVRIQEDTASRAHALTTVVPSRALLQTSTLGMDSFAADMLWLKALEYFGDSRHRSERYQALPTMLKLITELDPQFCIVYRKAGLMLTSSEINDMYSVEKLLDRGVKECPHDAFIPFVQGFNLYFFQRRFSRAADYLDIASQRDGGNEGMANLAVRLRAQSGDLDSLETMLTVMSESEGDDKVRQTAEKNLAHVRSERVLRQIDRAIAAATAPGYTPKSIADLVKLGVLPAGVADPAGGSLSIEGGVARSSSLPHRLSLKEEALFRELW